MQKHPVKELPYNYLNVGNAGFQSVKNGIYVDKSELIAFINKTIGTSDKLTCVSRPRRFGKSFAAKMLSAYYDKSCDSRKLFQNLKISEDPSFEKYLNRYNVIYLDITWFISNVPNIRDTVSYLQKKVIHELHNLYPHIQENDETLPMILSEISVSTGEKFFIIIDEWDALFREAKENILLQEEYIQLLRGLFKSSLTDTMIEAAYMTGILPIKKYGTQSALTDFREYTMIQPKKLAEYVGFTESEVQYLCQKYHMDFNDMKKWYDGYSFRSIPSVYSPNSVMESIKNEEFATYWTQTETYESLRMYINADFDGLKEDIISMLAGNRCRITTRKFQNDMINIGSKDDILTLLVHLGYLAFDSETSEIFIPNLEVADEFQNAVDDGNWEEIAAALRTSDELLNATLAGNAEAVAEAIDAVHTESISVLSYNNENSLSCVISIAYFSARKDYVILRELPTGKGFADVVFLPRKNSDKPPMIIELKWDKSANGAIKQIKEKQYYGALNKYEKNMLLVGINYNKKTKKHECLIEKYNNFGKKCT